MKIRSLFSLFFLVACSTINAQESSSATQSISSKIFLEELFQSDKPFAEIIEEADAHFISKYPNVSFAALCIGEHRDGAFVKYQRWQSFWKNHLNPDGTLGDFTKVKDSDGKRKQVFATNCDDSDVTVEWTNVNYDSNMGYQIDQGRTSAIAFHPNDPNTYYVGASWGGLWKTTDGGASHSIINDDLPLAAISGIVIDPSNPDNIAIALSDIIWYGVAGIGIYVSNDGGDSFTATDISWELNDDVRVYYMDQDPNNGDHIMFACSEGLYKTEDFFETSTLVQTGNMRHVTYSQTTPDLVFAGGSSGQFYKSTDGGDNFDLTNDFGSGQVRIAVSILEGSEHVAVTSGSALNVSEDNGETFLSRTLPESNMVVAFAPSSETVLQVGNFEVHRSDNFGESFYPITQWLGNDGLPFIHVDQRNVFVNPLQEDYVYFCNDGGVFRYNTATETFANLSRDLLITQYYDIAVSQTESMVLGGGSQDNGNIFRDSDGSWDAYAGTGDGMGQEIDPSDAGVRYWSYQFGGMNRWENGGNTGIAPDGQGGNGAWETPFKLDPNNSDRLFAAFNSVYASDDNGDSWYTIGNTVSPSSDLEQLAIAPSNSERVYASRGNKLYVKDLDSDDWDQRNTPSGQSITDLEVDFLDENTIYISYGGYADGKKIYKSEDAGQNWTNITANLPNLPFLSLELHYNLPGGVFVGSYGAVYYIDENSEEWKKYGCLPYTSINDIEIQYQSNKIFVGTHGRGIFEAPDAFNTTSIENEFSPNELGLSLYPNPANNWVSIQSEKQNLNQSKIYLTDVMGRSIAPNTTSRTASEIKLDASALSEGIYFITIEDKKDKRYVIKFVVQ